MTTQMQWRVVAADPRSAPHETLRAVAAHREAIRAERLPGDPAWPLEVLVTQMQNVPRDEDALQFNVWNEEGRVIGHAALFLPLLENTHLGFVELSVQAPGRRLGMGRALLGGVVAHAEASGRRTLIGSTSDRVFAGEAFARRIGARAALPTHTNQLELAELSPALLEAWIREGAARAREYRVWLNVETYPHARLHDIADLCNVMNTAPRGDLDLKDWRVTQERLCEWEEKRAKSGERRISAFAEHRGSGELVGFSELFWQPERDTLLFQGATGVRPEHRGQGLGRWLKAANLQEALARNPQARFVRTGNADSNAGMLAINRALGFKPLIANTDWQIETAQARAFLGAHA